MKKRFLFLLLISFIFISGCTREYQIQEAEEDVSESETQEQLIDEISGFTSNAIIYER